jgi:ankyrin repeat protein
LSWAVETQDARLVRLLLTAKVHPDTVANATAAPLLLACEHGDPAVLSLLLDAGADPKRIRPDGISAVALCAGTAPASIVARLLDGGAVLDHADADGQTALMRAAARGRIETLKLLVARGADVNRTTRAGFTPLFFALKSGDPEAPVALLEAGADANHRGPEDTTAVQLAMYQRDYGFARRMIERGADLGALDRNGHSLLHAAVIAGQPALVSLLLARGAAVDQTTGKPRVDWRYEANFRSGDVVMPAKSAMLLAAEGGSAEIMELLAAAGADPAFRIDDGTSLLHAATGSGKAAALRVALKLQPAVNAIDQNGQTPLHQLLRQQASPDLPAMLGLLAAAGARTDLRNRLGQTPVDLLQEATVEVRAAFAAAFGSRTDRS